MKLLIDRRIFLKSLGLVGASWATRGWTAPMTTTPFSPSLIQVSETRNLMGTFVTQTLFHPSSQQAQDALGSTFEFIETQIQIFDRHQTTSALGHLNDKGVMVNPPPELVSVLRSAQAIHSKTGGQFDVTIKPVLDLYEAEKEKEFGKLPKNQAIEEALTRVGAANLKVESKRILFQKEGMGLTLDGIAKGTIVDKAVAFLRRQGIEHALVVAGGDLRVIGGRPVGHPWRIAVYDPINKTQPMEMVILNEGAAATSGNYMVYFDEEKVHYHILSLESGVSPLWSASATILAPSAEEADGLATGLMLLNPEQGLSLINRDSRLAAMLITREGQRIRSLRWPKSSDLTRRINSA